MNIFYLLTVIIISFLYTNSSILRKNKTITALSISVFAFILYKYTELFYLLLGLSIIIFFTKTKKKESFRNFDDYRLNDNIGEKLIKNKYNNLEYYPKIHNEVIENKNTIKENIYIDNKYNQNSLNVIRDDEYLLNNLENQIKKYGKQGELNNELYNTENAIYNFENDQLVDQINTPEWWERYDQLENNKSLIQGKINENSGKIINLQTDNLIITRNLNDNKKKLKNIRKELNHNINVIDENQKCTVYGMDQITKKYTHPKKQNKYYGVTNAPDSYQELDIKKKYSITQILNAYRKHPEIISKCVENINNDSSNGNERNKIDNNCKNKVEINPVYTTK